jgi:hypothetical protein
MDYMGEGISGTARAIQYRNELSGGYSSGSSVSVQSRTVLTFRVDPGDGGPPVPVELKGLSIEGDIAEGDWVDVYGRYRPGRVLKAKAVVNRTTGVPVEARGAPGWAKAIAVILAIAIIGFIAWIAITGFTNFPAS